MSTYLKLFETHAEYQSYSGGGGDSPFVKPNVSHCIEDNHVHYNPYIPPFFCKLKLNDGSTVDIEGSGELTRAMVSDQYKNTLVSAEIGELCTSIGDYAFTDCVSLTSVVISDSVKNTGGGAFYQCSNLLGISIPDGVTSIDDYIFFGCTKLTSVEIPDSVTSIGLYAFHDCDSLTNVTIPNGVTSIGNEAFQSCNGLTNITIPNSVTTIGQYAFNACSGLRSVIIGSGVRLIKGAAFDQCTIPEGVTSLAQTPPEFEWGYDNFRRLNGPIYVPAESVDAYKTAIGWKQYVNKIQAITQ